MPRSLNRTGGATRSNSACAARNSAIAASGLFHDQSSRYESTSCSFFNIEGFVQSARSLGLAVTAHRSLMNLPLVEVPRDAPAPIDRTVFTCVRDAMLDDVTTLNYWDGNFTGARPPNWKGESD